MTEILEELEKVLTKFRVSQENLVEHIEQPNSEKIVADTVGLVEEVATEILEEQVEGEVIEVVNEVDTEAVTVEAPHMDTTPLEYGALQAAIDAVNIRVDVLTELIKNIENRILAVQTSDPSPVKADGEDIVLKILANKAKGV